MFGIPWTATRGNKTRTLRRMTERRLTIEALEGRTLMTATPLLATPAAPPLTALPLTQPALTSSLSTSKATSVLAAGGQALSPTLTATSLSPYAAKSLASYSSSILKYTFTFKLQHDVHKGYFYSDFGWESQDFNVPKGYIVRYGFYNTKTSNGAGHVLSGIYSSILRDPITGDQTGLRLKAYLGSGPLSDQWHQCYTGTVTFEYFKAAGDCNNYLNGATPRYALAYLYNHTKETIIFAYQWGDAGTLTSVTLKPGYYMRFTYKVPVSQPNSPELYVFYQDVFNKSTRVVSLQRARSPVADDRANYGNDYEFVKIGAYVDIKSCSDGAAAPVRIQ